VRVQAVNATDAGAAAVMWGWTARVMRTAEAALTLHRDGFDIEVAPPHAVDG
jgi:CheY-specific phosphatase CheX